MQPLLPDGCPKELGAEVTVSYSITDKDQTAFTVTDTFTLVGYWDYDELMPVHYINISRDYADDIEAQAVKTGLQPFRTDLNVMLASGTNIQGQMEQVDTDLGYTWDSYTDPNSVRIGVNWGYTSSQLESQLDPELVIAIAAFLLLVIFTGYLIIYNIGAVLVPVVLRSTQLDAGITTISTSPVIFVGSVLFALLTVLLSCSKPGKMAARVSPVEATKYTDAMQTKKKQRSTRGAKLHQMAFANLGRNKGRNKKKTVLVVVSLALSVTLFNALCAFVGGFSMEKYVSFMTCADFIVSTPDYFRYNPADEFITPEQIEEIAANTKASLSGTGYAVRKPAYLWMTEDALRQIAVSLDDYGNLPNPEYYPKVGDTITATYADDVKYIDSRTGELRTEDTPEEYFQAKLYGARDVEYTVCALVELPNSNFRIP